ncbi:protein kinase [Microbispora sp. ZYX-F-249]|uniref:Protein kinase n=1 Tax=Microbispora maris TaxID=3144104 RepID=A0ABV0AS49_9ACTN
MLPGPPYQYGSRGPGGDQSRKSFWWALAPLLTCGLGTPFVVAFAAIRLRERRLALAAGGYSLGLVAFIVATNLLEGVPRDDWRNNVTAIVWFGTMWAGGAIHTFLLRPRVFPRVVQAAPQSHPAPPSYPASRAYAAPVPPAYGAGAPATPPTRPLPHASGPYPTGPYSSGPHAAPGPSAGVAWVGPYALLTKVGEGGQGTVYLGQAPDGQQVAVKILHVRIGPDSGERDAFVREALAARRVPSFATARVIDVGVEGGLAYIVSEYVHGPSLDRLVREQGPRNPDSLTRLSISTLAALRGIHNAGIVHRDFKPANVLLGADGPRVIDFGIARAMDRLTTSAGTKGTPAFMSPEQVLGEQAGPASDLFSWGSTMYYAASGRLPFDGPSVFAVSQQIMEHSPDLGPLPAALRRPLAAALAKDPRARPTAADLLLALSG